MMISFIIHGSLFPLFPPGFVVWCPLHVNQTLPPFSPRLMLTLPTSLQFPVLSHLPLSSCYWVLCLQQHFLHGRCVLCLQTRDQADGSAVSHSAYAPSGPGHHSLALPRSRHSTSAVPMPPDTGGVQKGVGPGCGLQVRYFPPPPPLLLSASSPSPRV